MYKVNRNISTANTFTQLEGLLGQHPRIKQQQMELQLEEFLWRLRHYQQQNLPAYQAYRAQRKTVLQEENKALRLHEFEPKPLASFVRNRLINEVYFPLVGENFAKQMGTVDNQRSDYMGLLLLISPPGYGKTTLMEYLAQRLGLIFVKINCPTLGHEVTALDPAQAPHATAARELEKLNLSLEMGNNVMLYLDDIQHSSPEFLQKFISLADGQRRIDGIWRGQTKSYDLRGKRFCIVMAGNPYTESGEAFQIPDMLANRADIYNLGDVLSGREAVFSLSYIENSLTSNPVLTPLANRDPEDIYRLVRQAQGEEVAAHEYSHPYSGSELAEMQTVMEKMLAVRDVLLKVNAEYIRSASQDDAYRTEPPFKLQGSYRNMSKLASKIVAVMNAKELEDLVSDHYQGEAQTLTTGAEENLLKLAALRGILSEAEEARWLEIKDGYQRRQVLGDDDDPQTQMLKQIGELGRQLGNIQKTLHAGIKRQAKHDKHSPASSDSAALEALLQQMGKQLKNLVELPTPQVTVKNQIPDHLSTTVERLLNMTEETLMPLVQNFERKSRMDLVLWNRLKEVSDNLKQIQKQILEPKKGHR